MFFKSLLIAAVVSIPVAASAMPVQKISTSRAIHAAWKQEEAARKATFSGDANSMYGWNSAANNDGGRSAGGAAGAGGGE